MSFAIETRKLSRAFDDFIAVDNLDLQVPKGCFFGFLGPNGAGKSTTIKMLTGLLRITSGSASILGQDVDPENVEARRRMGVVPEDLALFERLTASEHLTFVGRMFEMEPALIQKRQNELLEMMNLNQEPKKLVVDFSHGMKKKLALAAALIHDPEVLFLDEPFEGIDAVASRQIKDLLNSLVSHGKTIFLTSHILEIVERLCSDIAIIHEGKLVAQGALEDLRRGVDVDTPAETSGDGVSSGPGERKTLEEIFLSIVNADEDPARTPSWLE